MLKYVQIKDDDNYEYDQSFKTYEIGGAIE